jgi:hypothetical protein
MTNYTITVEVDQQWLDILGQITKHQEGFCWVTVSDPYEIEVVND